MDDYKKQVENKLVEIMANALDAKQLEEKDLPPIADYILGHIDKIKNYDQLIGFLSHISLQWPVFSSIAIQEESKLKRILEQKVAENVLGMIRENRVHEAIQLARNYIK